MKRSRLLLIAAMIVAVHGVVALKITAQLAPVLDTQQKKASYALGLNLGKALLAQKVEIDSASVTRGLQDGLDGTSLLTDQQIQSALEAWQKETEAKMAGEGGQKTQSAEAAFLAENAKKPGVQQTASGLQYEIVTAGTGPKPAATDQVSVHYRGTLIDGKEFDSSYARNQPATFPVSRVITGWNEALQLMPVGSKWKLWLPSALAYRPDGSPGGSVPPDSMLIFEVELLSIVPK